MIWNFQNSQINITQYGKSLIETVPRVIMTQTYTYVRTLVSGKKDLRDDLRLPILTVFVLHEVFFIKLFKSLLLYIVEGVRTHTPSCPLIQTNLWNHPLFWNMSTVGRFVLLCDLIKLGKKLNLLSSFSNCSKSQSAWYRAYDNILCIESILATNYII